MFMRKLKQKIVFGNRHIAIITVWTLIFVSSNNFYAVHVRELQKIAGIRSLIMCIGYHEVDQKSGHTNEVNAGTSSIKIIGQTRYSWEAMPSSPTHGINITTYVSIITHNRKQRFFCFSSVLPFDLRQITYKFCLCVALVLSSCEWEKSNVFGRVQPKIGSRSCYHH